VLPFDTSPEAHEAQMQAYRRMGAAARVRIGFSMSEDVREIAAHGIRSRHPDYGQAQVRSALFRLLYGDELTRAVWPDQALVAP
jgi:hypothetical protein